MTDKKQATAMIQKWMDSAIRVQDTFGKIEAAFMASPENKIRGAIWSMFDEYTKTLAAMFDASSDPYDWLDWFAWECDFGRKSKMMQFADDEELLVVGAADLVDAIMTDENGNRTP